MKDYYGILGVSEQAAEKDIKAAYRKLAKLYQPDGPMKPEEMFAAFFGRQNHKGDGR